MDFNEHIQRIIEKANQIQLMIDKKEVWFDEPYQNLYLQIVDLIDVCEEKKADIDTISLDGLNVNPELLSTRRLYDEYHEKIPYFLSEGGTNFFLIKSYYSVCFQLIKSFSHSSHESDRSKLSNLTQWISALDKAEKSMDAADSAEASLDFIRPLHPFETMPKDAYAQFQAEVINLQSLITTNPELETSLTGDDLGIIAEATTFLTENPHLFESLQFEEPVVEFDNESLHEVVADRCHQICIFLDEFKDEFGIFKKIKDMNHFTSSLSDSFNTSIDICNDIYSSILTEIGSHKSPTVKKLCKMVMNGLESFSDVKWLKKEYTDLDIGYFDLEDGIPTNNQVEEIIQQSID